MKPKYAKVYINLKNIYTCEYFFTKVRKIVNESNKYRFNFYLKQNRIKYFVMLVKLWQLQLGCSSCHLLLCPHSSGGICQQGPWRRKSQREWSGRALEEAGSRRGMATWAWTPELSQRKTQLSELSHVIFKLMNDETSIAFSRMAIVCFGGSFIRLHSSNV